MAVERRLQLLPDLLPNFRWGALLGWLAHVDAGRVPVRDVNGEDAANRPIAVAVAEQPPIGPKLRLRNRRESPRGIRVERVAAHQRHILLEEVLSADHPRHSGREQE
jgi:hypothetical protein